MRISSHQGSKFAAENLLASPKLKAVYGLLNYVSFSNPFTTSGL